MSRKSPESKRETQTFGKGRPQWWRLHPGHVNKSRESFRTSITLLDVTFREKLKHFWKQRGCPALTQADQPWSCGRQEAGLKPELNRGLCVWGGGILKPYWALPASETREATHGNAITPPVTQLLMEPGGAWREPGQRINRHRGKLLKTQLLLKV